MIRRAILVFVIAAVVLTGQQSAKELLLTKARSLEGRGRLDLAAQTWQQVLLADPNNTEALAGLARFEKQAGRPNEAERYLERLRRLDPKNASIPRAESVSILAPHRERLQEASRLAANQRFDEAMQIFRQVFGGNPPPGGWAIAYYETQAATPGGWEHATTALRKLADEYPNVADYRFSLGRLLTYRPETRIAGLRQLELVQGDPAVVAKAKQSWRQALVWEGANPAILPSLRAYLVRHSDPELQTMLGQIERLEASRGPVRSREEGLGYAALQAGQLKEAEAHFTAALKEIPNSSGAIAGIGFVRMKQEDFTDAVERFELALAAKPNDKVYLDALGTARFFLTMKEATAALEQGRTAKATELFRNALTARPDDPDALRGYAGSLLKAEDYSASAETYAQLARLQPEDADAWRNLVAARYKDRGAAAALQHWSNVPEKVQNVLLRNVSHLAVLASAYNDIGQTAESQRLLQNAVDLTGIERRSVAVPLQLQLAGMLSQQGKPVQAAAIYQKVVDENPNNIDAWEGLLAGCIQAKDQARASAALQRMPKSAYSLAITRPAFLRSAAIIQERAGFLDVAERFLEAARATSGTNETLGNPLATDLQLSYLWLKKGEIAKTERLLRILTENHRDNPEVHRANLTLLHRKHEDLQAIEEAKKLPENVAAALREDADYVSLLAAIYNSARRYSEGLDLAREAVGRLEFRNAAVPADLQIQFAWLLLNSQSSERELYGVLTKLTARTLDPEQRRSVGEIWANWGLRRAEVAGSSGDLPTAVAILTATLEVVPRNTRVLAGMAGLLMKFGDHKRALAVYRSWGLASASAADYCGAIGAAMAQRHPQATIWLREGLTKFPKDPQLLSLAGKIAAHSGDLQKAEWYWRRALSELPAVNGLNPSETFTGETDEGKALFQNIKKLGTLLGSEAGYSNPSDPMPFASTEPSADTAPTPVATNGPPVSFETRAMLRPADLFPGDDRTAPGTTGNEPQIPSLPETDPAARKPTRQLLDPDRGRIDSLLDPEILKNLQFPQNLVASSRTGSPRREIEDQIAAIASRNSPFLGTGGSVNSRTGRAGFEQRVIQEAELETNVSLGSNLRLSFSARPTVVDAGMADGQSELRFGLLPQGADFGSQAAGGIGADVSLATFNFGLKVGSTPRGFLAPNVIGGIRLRPGGGPITILFQRESVRDSLLSFAGTRDPISKQVWGGVVSTGISLGGNWGSEQSGFYANSGVQYLTGRNVARNKRVDGTMGTYWRVLALPDGSLTLGLNFSAMHYEKNLRFYTLGHGGYFSPQRYFLFSVPTRWTGTWRERGRYSISGTIGSQHFQEDAAPYFPTLPALQGRNGPVYPSFADSSVNYSLDAVISYQIAPNWYLSGFLNANNTRNFSTQSAGLSVKYMFKERPVGVDVTPPAIPDWRGTHLFQLP